MKDKIFAAIEIIVAVILIYMGLTAPQGSMLFNILEVISGIFLILMGLDHLDKVFGNGKYNRTRKK